MPNQQDVAGVYRQIGAEFVSSGGSATSTGETRNSQLMYSADGYVSIVSTPPGRKKLSSSNSVDLNNVPGEQLADAVKDMVVYAGRFVLKDDVVEHHVDMALNPNLVGGVVVRRLHLDGADLTLSSAPAEDGSYRRIRWRRVPAS